MPRDNFLSEQCLSTPTQLCVETLLFAPIHKKSISLGFVFDILVSPRQDLCFCVPC